MPNTKRSVLIVEDDRAIRTSLSCVLEEIGYRVRTAEEGFAALVEIRSEVPEILISDLNMPGMSGFELLSVVRRNFPNVRTIAMSGAFGGDEVPSGVAADAFYQKGSSVGCLLRIMESLPLHERKREGKWRERSSGWIVSDGRAATGETRITVSCPECLRTFSHALNQSVSDAWEGVCTHCQSMIHLGKIPSSEPGFEALSRSRNASESPKSQSLQAMDCQ